MAADDAVASALVPSGPAPKVVDTNVLTVATGATEGWTRPRIPTDDAGIIHKVFQWVAAFRKSTELLVLDYDWMIQTEYSNNIPSSNLYGRQVVQDKIDRNQVRYVKLEHWMNGNEKVAELPDDVTALLHDLGDRKMVAAAAAAAAILVNATDSDWSNEAEQEALKRLKIQLEQVLTDEEREQCRERR